MHPGKGAVKTIRVIDYKNSRSAKRYGKLAEAAGAQFGWTDFQLPVYLMGALGEFDERLAANVTLQAGYLVLRNRDKAQIAEVARNLIDPDPKRRAAATKSGERPVAERMIALVDDALGRPLRRRSAPVRRLVPVSHGLPLLQNRLSPEP